MDNKKELKKHLLINLTLLVVGIMVAVVLAKTGVFKIILNKSQNIWLLGSFVAGVFFTSVLTVGSATVAIITLAESYPIVWVAAIGAAGSVLGDLVLFKFVRDRISDEFLALFKEPKAKRLTQLLHLEIFRFLAPIMGAFIIASPLPDEIGLAMMGLSKIKTRTFILLSYTLNFLDILTVSLIARVIN